MARKKKTPVKPRKRVTIKKASKLPALASHTTKSVPCRKCGNYMEVANDANGGTCWRCTLIMTPMEDKSATDKKKKPTTTRKRKVTSKFERNAKRDLKEKQLAETHKKRLRKKRKSS